MYIKHNGGWLEAFPFLKYNGKWVETEPLLKNSGKWVSVGGRKFDIDKVSEKTIDISRYKIQGVMSVVAFAPDEYAIFSPGSEFYKILQFNGGLSTTRNMPAKYADMSGNNRNIFHYNGNYFIGLRETVTSYAALERIAFFLYRTNDFKTFTKVGEIKNGTKFNFDYINKKLYCCDDWKAYSYDFNGLDTISNEIMEVDFKLNKGPLTTFPTLFFKDYNDNKFYVGTDYKELYEYNKTTKVFTEAYKYGGGRLITIKNKNYFDASSLKGKAITTDFKNDLTMDRENKMFTAIESNSDASDFTTFDAVTDAIFDPVLGLIVANKSLTITDWKINHKKLGVNFELNGRFSYVLNAYSEMSGRIGDGNRIVNTEIGTLELSTFTMEPEGKTPFQIGLREENENKYDKKMKVGFFFNGNFLGDITATMKAGAFTIKSTDAKSVKFILSNLPQKLSEVEGKSVDISITEILPSA